MTPLGPPPPRNPLTLPLFHSNLKFLILTSLLLTQLKFHGQSLRSPPRIHSHSTSVFASWYLLSKPSALVSPAPMQLNVAGQNPTTTGASLIWNQWPPATSGPWPLPSSHAISWSTHIFCYFMPPFLSSNLQLPLPMNKHTSSVITYDLNTHISVWLRLDYNQKL